MGHSKHPSNATIAAHFVYLVSMKTLVSFFIQLSTEA
jgi:hypothetical protein